MTRPLPYLGEMYQAELDSLIGDLDALSRAGALLIELGQTPVFRLVPGQLFQITLDEVMPHVAEQAPQLPPGALLSALPRASVELDMIAKPAVDLAVDPLIFTEIAKPVPEQTADAGAQDTAGGADEAPTPAGDGGGCPAAPAPAVATTQPAPWTPEEDDKLIGLVACLILSGVPKRLAISHAAQDLGRPEQGSSYRIYNKLAARLQAEIDQLRARAEAELIETHQPDPAPTAPQEASAEDAAGVAVFHAPAASQIAEPQPPLPTALAAEQADGAAFSPAPSADLSPIEAHLHSLSRKGGWTMERDHELLGLICDGWAMPEISAEMSIPAGDLKARFDLLSGLHRNANDKLVRRWSRDELLAALTPWVKSQAAE